ncbi:sulfate transporter family protein [Alsobacter sp. R-9]
MIVVDAIAALAQILSPPFRKVLWKSLGLTLALLALVWLALTRLLNWWLTGNHLVDSYPWLDAYAALLAGFGLVVALAFLIPPVSMLVAGFFLDDVADLVERESFPQDPPGTALPLGPAMIESAKFAALSLGVNLVALMLLLVPGINLLAFFLANTVLLGREYFTLAAGRFRPRGEVAALRQRNGASILLAGALIAALVLVPVVNLLTPLFGTALMVRVHKRLAWQDARPTA